MKKRWIILIAILAILVVMTVGTLAAQEEDIFFLAGQYFQSDADTGSGINSTGNSAVVAEYADYKILQSQVDYNRSTALLSDPEYNATDREIIDQIITEIMVYEEALRLGLEATQEEIDQMYQENLSVYELPEGKEVIDSYCAGAGLTVEEYFAVLREKIPRIITKRKLEIEVGQDYCEANGLEYTHINPPEEMKAAVKQYIADLFEANKGNIVYSSSAALTE